MCVCVGQYGVFVYLVLRCFVGCCTRLSCCADNVGLSIIIIIKPEAALLDNEVFELA